MKKFVITIIVIVIAAIYIWSECSDSNNEVDIERFDNVIKLSLKDIRADNLVWEPDNLVWGPDSQRLFFKHDDYICTVTTDGNSFTQTFKAYNPVISADGEEIFFTSVPTYNDIEEDIFQFTLYLLAMDLDGNNLRDLGEFNAVSSMPIIELAISPTGEWIATSTVENTQVADIPEGETIRAPHLKIWNIETGMEMIDSLMFISGMQWSPDSSRLAIAGEMQNDPDQDEWGIWIIDVGSGEMVNVSSSLTVGGEPVSFLHDPVWNADGSKILFSTYNYLEQKRLDVYTVWTAEADGSGCELLTTQEICKRQRGVYDWSPDGTQIALVTCLQDSDSSAMTKQEIRIIDIENTEEETLFSLSSNTGDINQIQWSPDGARIALAIPQRSTTEIYLVDVQ